MKRYDVVAATSTYTDREGNEKKRWITCGAVFEKEGRLSLKLECVPVGEWNGFFSLFEPRPLGQQAPTPKADEPPPFEDDRIPFD